MIEINWNPTFYIGPVPIQWYGMTWMLGFLVGEFLTRRWAPKFDIEREKIEGMILWILIGSLIGARIYFILQDDATAYLSEPRRILAIWEGGLAYFGGLFGGALAAYLYARREGVPFWLS